MKVGWIDGTAGASGDMLLGAIVGAGVPLALIQQHIDRFELGITLRSEIVTRAGLAATRVHVDVPETATLRHLADVVAVLERLDGVARERSIATFQRLAQAEAQVHGSTIEEVHFHEVGALDSIADVVGVCVGLDALGLDELHCSTLGLGSGTTRGAHGPIPVPVPAVLAVLEDIAPINAGPAPYESTTPTGAALLAEWVTSWGPMPSIVLDATGMGAGTKDTDVVANVCRLVIGEDRVPGTTASSNEHVSTEMMIQLDANVDDLDPRVWPEAIAAVMRAGAVDAWVTPIVMKKGRPAHTFSALTRSSAAADVVQSMFVQTSTIGIRQHAVHRHVLDRSESTVEYRGQEIRVKTAWRDGEIVNQSVEWDDVVRSATTLRMAPNDVLAAVNRQL